MRHAPIKIVAASAVCLIVAGWLASTTDAQSQRGVDAGLAHFNANRAVYGLDDPSSSLRARDVRQDPGGVTHVRYSQVYQNVPIFEGEAIAHVEADGTVSVTSGVRRIAKLNITPASSRDAAIQTAVADTALLGGYSIHDASLWVLPAGRRSVVDRLVWHVAVLVENEFQEPAKWRYFVDAHDGSLVWKFNALETSAAKGLGKTMYSGTQTVDIDRISVAGISSDTRFFLRDLTRGTGNFTCDMSNRWSGACPTFSRLVGGLFGNSRKDSSDRATAGADAHFGLQSTWAFYKTMFGRTGINGTNRRTYSRVHFGSGFANAFWDPVCYCMTYGDGDPLVFFPVVSLDVAAHEISHGVLASEANLTYDGESGGLNESNSDIFGTLVEFSVNAAADVPDYWIGERVFRTNYDANGNYRQRTALRYMDNPGKDGLSPACWYDGIGALNVHYSSGPNNHMFYLLSHGGTSRCNGQVVAGIGNDKAARIWYKAITDYMLPSTDYHGALYAALNAAGNLYGGGSREFNAVLAAYAAINVR